LSVISESDEKEFVFWDFIEDSTVNFRIQIKTSDIESDVDNIISDVED